MRRKTLAAVLIMVTGPGPSALGSASRPTSSPDDGPKAPHALRPVVSRFDAYFAAGVMALMSGSSAFSSSSSSCT